MASRQYRFEFSSAAVANVRFSDGGLFHELDLRDGEWRMLHHCGDDRYDGWVRACGNDAWQLTWRVLGPHKNLLIVSDYRRSAARQAFAGPAAAS